MTACANAPTASQRAGRAHGARAAPLPATRSSTRSSPPTPSSAASATTCPASRSTDEAGDHVGFDADFCRVLAAGVLGDSTKVDVRRPRDRRPLPRAAVGRDRRARAQHHVDGEPGRHRGCDVPAPDVLRRPGDDGRRRLRLRVDRRHGRRGGLRRRRHDHRGQRRHRVRPPRPHRRRPVVRRASTCSRRRSSPGVATAGRATTASSTACARPTRTGPRRSTIFPDIFTKEPLAPAVVDGDSRWAQAVNWAIFATIQAEEYGLTQDNVDDGLTSDDPNVVDVPRRRQRRRHRVRPRPRPRRRLRLQHRLAGRQLRRDLRAQPRRRSGSSAASTHCGPTAACSTPRPTGDRSLTGPTRSR